MNNNPRFKIMQTALKTVTIIIKISINHDNTANDNLEEF